MIRDVDDLTDGARIEAEVGIVGAGFAGIDLARFLSAQGIRVVLLESGRADFDPATQELARIVSVGKPVRSPDPDGPFTPYLDPIFRGEFRIRQFGGTSNIWTGKWRTFDELDFAHRPWVPFSGWPITRDELEPFYRQVSQDYGLGDFDAFARDPAVVNAKRRLEQAGLELSFHYWENRAVRPATRFRDDLQQASHADVVLGANATEIVLADDLRTVESIVFRALDGRRFELRARQFVLCVGGLEGARLLLASNRQIPAGIGNANGLVGRFHMDHPKSKQARLLPGPNIALIAPWTRTRPRPRFHVSLSLADDVQRQRRLLDHAIYFKPVYSYLIDYPQELADRLRQALRSAHPGRIISVAMAILGSPRKLRKMFQRWRYADVDGPVAYYQASMYVEQAPNRDSTLSLGSERDALGMPRLVMNWQLTPFDHDSLRQTLEGLCHALRNTGIGELDFGGEPLTLDNMVDAAHHISATRMAATPETGVVDSNCRVFGTANLFIASSSVFPTGHSAAPTMTILAIARRLGTHLLGLRAENFSGEIDSGKSRADGPCSQGRIVNAEARNR
jgi:choline dehydrogenase-like flavoprotein